MSYDVPQLFVLGLYSHLVVIILAGFLATLIDIIAHKFTL
ncbi:MAG: hypothetical protein ACI917_001532, partial [Patiriisocius sp.]